jgi:mevalonate kinase
MGVGYGFGKIILIGDQFINYGVPAIVSALDLTTKAVVERSRVSNCEIEDLRKETPRYKESKLKQQKESIKRIFEIMKIKAEEHSIRIVFEGDLIAASGLGASAASCVALARALSMEFHLGLGDHEINDIAFEGEKAYHGTPSGVDNTASTFGGILLFKKDVTTKKNSIEEIKLARSIEFIVADSGVVFNTATLGPYIRERMQKERILFEHAFEIIQKQVSQMLKALDQFDLVQIGDLLSENHREIIKLGLSHEKVIELCDLACQNGALGAKVTGAGMGGNMIALTPGMELQEKVALALEHKGFKPLKVKIGAETVQTADIGP